MGNVMKKGGSFNSVFHGMNFSICLKIPEKYQLRKIPMIKESNLTWASNPWPTRYQLLFSYFRKCSKFFKKRFHQKKKKKKKSYHEFWYMFQKNMNFFFSKK